MAIDVKKTRFFFFMILGLAIAVNKEWFDMQEYNADTKFSDYFKMKNSHDWLHNATPKSPELAEKYCRMCVV